MILILLVDMRMPRRPLKWRRKAAIGRAILWQLRIILDMHTTQVIFIVAGTPRTRAVLGVNESSKNRYKGKGGDGD
jgi:hypothetical protein